MKRALLFVTVLMFASVSYAQNMKPVAQKINQKKSQQEVFEPVRLFEITATAKERTAQLKNAAGSSVVMEFQRVNAQTILLTQPENLLFVIPTDGGKNIELELSRANLFTPDFSVVTSATNDKAVAFENGVHYQGIIKGDNSSVAAISIFNDEVIGIISSDEDGNVILGKLENDFQGKHILYKERDLPAPTTTGCFTPEYPMTYSPSELQYDDANRTVNCVRLYWEANYDLYVNKGSSVTNVVNYLTAVFNQSNIIYANDGISTVLSEIYVWNTTSPYTGTTTSSLLSQFQSFRNSFNGDLGHLLGLAGGGGVAAGFSGICNSNLDASQCYSGISSSYNSFPTYSWTVEVVTHEQGHLLGSRHTHACVWNGNNTAIDNCGPTAGYGYEGSCSSAPSPGSAGGTIMSYCHLVGGVGINFNNGFGTQPKNVILSRINNGLCLTACTSPTCSAPAGMNTTAITTSSANFNWTAVSGATSYNVRYKLVTTSIWTNASSATTSYNASGLNSSANYEWQVQTVCASGSSAFTASTNFMTATAPCNAATGMNTSAISATSATFSWFAVSGALSYNIQYRVVTTSTWSTGSSSNTSFNATGLTPGANYEWQVQTICTGGSSAFTASTLFTTLTSVCTDVYEPNNSKNSATLIPLSTDIFALINPSGEFDWFRFSNTSTQRNIRITLTNLPANYNLRLYGNNGNYVAISQNAGNALETINFNTTTVGTWRIRVDGFNGAFHASQCYTVRAEISSTPFSSPEGMSNGSAQVFSQPQLNLYPNPAHGNVTVEFNSENNSMAVVNLYSLLGEKIFSLENAMTEGGNSIELNTSTFAEGVYIFEMLAGDNIIRQKLVISK